MLSQHDMTELHSPVESMPAGVHAVFKAKGEITKYLIIIGPQYFLRLHLSSSKLWPKTGDLSYSGLQKSETTGQNASFLQLFQL